MSYSILIELILHIGHDTLTLYSPAGRPVMLTDPSQPQPVRPVLRPSIDHSSTQPGTTTGLTRQLIK